MVNRMLGGSASGFTPFSLVVLYGWMAHGALSIASYFVKHSGVFMTLPFMPPILEPITGILIFIGALLMILSNRDWKNISDSWVLDNVGMSFALGGWISYIFGINFANWEALGGILMCTIFIVAIIARMMSTYSYEKFVTIKVRKLWKSGSIQ